MPLKILHDKSTILTYLSQNTALQIYCIGDLDDFYWNHTIWYAWVEEKQIQSLALFYANVNFPTLLLFVDKNLDHSKTLLKQIRPLLPPKFYAHLNADLIEIFAKENIMESYGVHYKMVLRNPPPTIENQHIKRLTNEDEMMIQNFYAFAYPENWFDKRMLDTEKYFGYFYDNQLIGVAGVHVYSKTYKVAALGNIAVHPDFRGQQIAYQLTATLCSDLIHDVDVIGLNVKIKNEYAIKCYQKIGFEIIANFEEFHLKNTT